MPEKLHFFAVRGENRGHRGVVEVSQDITDIRKIDGEKRLLDWESSG